MEFIGSLLSILAAIVLIVLGARDRDSTGSRTKAGRRKILLGIIVLLSSFLTGWPDFVDGLRKGYGSR